MRSPSRGSASPIGTSARWRRSHTSREVSGRSRGHGADRRSCGPRASVRNHPTRRARGNSVMAFQIAGTPEADAVLDEYPFAVVVGMMLDQQYGMEHAFRGGWKVFSRFGSLDPGAIAAADPEEFKALCSTPPAIHRYPGSMAARLQELAGVVDSQYGGDVTKLWNEATTGKELLRRV